MSTKTVTHDDAWDALQLFAHLRGGDWHGKVSDSFSTVCDYINQQSELESRNSPEAIAKRIVDAARGCSLGDDRYAAISFLRSMANADPSVSSPSIEPFATRILADVIRGEGGG